MSTITYPTKEERLVRPAEIPPRNERKARCAFRWHGPRCYVELKKGEGYAYKNQYYCREHYLYEVAFDALTPRRLEAQAQIEAWCKENVSLGMGSIAANHISEIVWRSGLYCANVAEEIVRQLPESNGQYSYAEVIGLVDDIAERVMNEPLIEEPTMPEWAEDPGDTEYRLRQQELVNECEGEES